MKKTTMTCFMALAALAITTQAHAETVTKVTVTESKPIPGVRQINFMSFDANKDGKLSMREVGDVLFGAFDGDHNGVIDNIEYDRASVMTVIPTEETTFTFYDYDSDGVTDMKEVGRDEFLARSNLMRFDKQFNGLSPRDFVNKNMNQLDLNHDNLIDKKEWQREYALIVKPKVAVQSRYNN